MLVWVIIGYMDSKTTEEIISRMGCLISGSLTSSAVSPQVWGGLSTDSVLGKSPQCQRATALFPVRQCQTQRIEATLSFSPGILLHGPSQSKVRRSSAESDQ